MSGAGGGKGGAGVGVSSNVGASPDHCGEEGAEPEVKAFDLPVDLVPKDLDQKNEKVDTSSQFEFPP